MHDKLGTKLTFSTIFHPHKDGQTEQTIQVLEDILDLVWLTLEGIGISFYHYVNSFIITVITQALICTIWGFIWERMYVSYNWFESDNRKPLGVLLEKDAQDKARSIQAKFLAAQSRQKKYAVHKVRDM